MDNFYWNSFRILQLASPDLLGLDHQANVSTDSTSAQMAVCITVKHQPLSFTGSAIK